MSETKVKIEKTLYRCDICGATHAEPWKTWSAGLHTCPSVECNERMTTIMDSVPNLRNCWMGCQTAGRLTELMAAALGIHSGRIDSDDYDLALANVKKMMTPGVQTATCVSTGKKIVL